MKSILVLEGGALRGIYTAGILDMLLENNIEVDAVVGVSAGALFGINYVSKQKGRCLKYNLEFCNNKNYMGYYSLLTTGNIMNKDFCFNKLIYETHPFDFETFKKSKIKFYAVVTNLETGEAEYIPVKDLEQDMEYLRASGSMPLVSRTLKINNKKYLDGAIGDSIPYTWAKENGYDRIIVVETKPKDYRKKKAFMLPFRLRYFKYPNFVKAVSNRYLIYNKEKDLIKKDENLGGVFVFRPSRNVPIKRIEKNPKLIQEMYDLGVSDFNERINEFKKFLSRK